MHMPGSIIADRYVLQDEVGHGGMGVVFRAYDVKLGRPVALKMVPSDTPHKSGHDDQLAAEARSASALNHPGVATVYDLVETADEKFIAFEFVEGLTLRKKLARSRFTVEETVEAGIQLAEALGAAHKCGLIHRDIKPENIMLMPKDENGWTRLKILDFGLAKLITRPLLPHEFEETSTTTSLSTVRRVVAGTIDYMSPEQLEGVDADARSDVFALGIVLYEMATGVNPFKGATPASTIANILREETPRFRDLNPAVRGELESLLRTCLHKRPEERYQSVYELLKDLHRCRDGFQVITTAQPPRNLERSVFGRAFAVLGGTAFRRWEVTHIRLCVGCLLLFYLSWIFKNCRPSSLGLALFFLESAGTACLLFVLFFLLYMGAFERSNLALEIRRTRPLLRLLAIVVGLLAWVMAAFTAVSHTVVALFLILISTMMVLLILIFKPVADNAALSELGRSESSQEL